MKRRFVFLASALWMVGCAKTTDGEVLAPPADPPVDGSTTSSTGTSMKDDVPDAPAPSPGAADIFKKDPDKPAPPPADPEKPSAPEDPTTFPNFVTAIKQNMPGKQHGAASVVRFVNVTSAFRLSMAFFSEPGFVAFTGNPGKSVSMGAAESGEQLMIVLGTLRAGHFDCGKEGFGLGFIPAGSKPTDPDSSWSDTTGGSCEFDLYAGDNPGEWQGKITGTLVSNDGQKSFVIESGYFYADHPAVAGFPQQGQPQPPQAMKPRFTH